ncbi:MAG: AzlC family ABC transporter permease [Anaerolineaceae bacterium]|nr:AzlC family ABC transporter permease [Anaerolineaceae bacterium]
MDLSRANPQIKTPRAEFWAGVAATSPLLTGDLPFGMLYGALALTALAPLPALAMSSIVFAGSAQIVAAQLFASATPGVVIVLTTFVVNLRHLLYGASLAPHLKHLPGRWQWLLAYLLTDEAYAIAITRYERPDVTSQGAAGTNAHWYTLGAGLTLWLSWQISTAVGIMLIARLDIPPEWGLDFILPLTFIALIMPVLADKAAWLAALAAGVMALLLAALPLKLGLIAAALSGIFVGVMVERLLPARRTAARLGEVQPEAE